MSKINSWFRIGIYLILGEQVLGLELKMKRKYTHVAQYLKKF